MDTIKIGGDARAFKFGINQSIFFCKLRNVSITDMNKLLNDMEGDDGSILRDLLWSALKEGARKEKKEFNYDPFDVGDWLDDTSEDDIAKMLNAWVESVTNGLPKKENKKKVIQKK